MAQVLEFIGNHPYLCTTFVVLLILFIRHEMGRGGNSLTPQQLIHLMNKENPLLLDIRDAKAYRAGHVINAKNIPLAQIEEQTKKYNKFKEQPVVILCQAGQHASIAAKTFKQKGFVKLYRLSGGILEWQNRGLPLIKS